MKYILALSLCVNTLLLFHPVHAKAADALEKMDDTASEIVFKLTPSYYQSSDGNNAVDVNLRAKKGDQTAWLGEYQDKSGYRQLRVGYESNLDLGLTRWDWSAQLASGGFVGGSLSAEIGGDTFGILGIGRTNLREYFNLNFDPNDAITFGIGSRAISKTELSLFQVRDDRLSTQQRVTHFVWRFKPVDGQRITVDSSYKSGLAGDAVFIHGYGLSVTYDYGQFFGRLARDQYANFTETDLTRISLGLRF